MPEQPEPIPPTIPQIRRWLAGNGWTERPPGEAGSFWVPPDSSPAAAMIRVAVPFDVAAVVPPGHPGADARYLWGVVHRIAGRYQRDPRDLAAEMTRFTPDPLALLSAIDGVGDLETVLLSLELINKHIDDGRTGDYQTNGLAWLQSRVGHVVREAGEAWDALENLTGASARKGVCGTRDDLLNEVGDTVVAAWLVLQHLTGNSEDAWAVILRTIEKCLLRIDVAHWAGEARR